MIQYAFDGPEIGSTGDVVFDQTARQAISVKEANIVNAKASTSGSFKFSGRGVKIAATKREAVLA